MALKAELRTKTGSSASKKARQEGLVPVTLYGQTVETTSLLINRREFEALLKREGTNAVFDIEYDGKTQKVLLKEYVKASLADAFYSVDLEAISANQVLQVEVPLVLVNDETVKEGVVALVANTILVESKPDAIPTNIEVDVTGMEIGSTKTVADLEMPEGVTVLTAEDEPVVSVSVPTEEPAEDTNEEEAEPEVIGEEAEGEADAE